MDTAGLFCFVFKYVFQLFNFLLLLSQSQRAINVLEEGTYAENLEKETVLLPFFCIYIVFKSELDKVTCCFSG